MENGKGSQPFLSPATSLTALPGSKIPVSRKTLGSTSGPENEKPLNLSTATTEESDAEGNEPNDEDNQRPTTLDIVPQPATPSSAKSQRQFRLAASSPIRSSKQTPSGPSKKKKKWNGGDDEKESDWGKGKNEVAKVASIPGVRYITEALIKKISRQESLANVHSLNLTLSRDDGGKKIKFIENLEGCANLLILSLSHNLIEKITRLDRLTKLRELNLSYNRIRTIQGIEALVNLRQLNLSHNQIEKIPSWLPQTLSALQVLRLEANEISSLMEASQLHSLPQLSELSILEANPIGLLDHARLFLIFRIPCLDHLDESEVTAQERSTANERFAKDEVDKLQSELQKRENALTALDKQKSDNDDAGLAASLEAAYKSKEDLEVEAKERDRELMETQKALIEKEQKLKQTTKQLQKSVTKSSQVEQELAFMKLDRKFDASDRHFHQMDDFSDQFGNPLQDSPYIGKAGLAPQLRHGREKKQRGDDDKMSQEQLIELMQLRNSLEEKDDELRLRDKVIEEQKKALHQSLKGIKKKSSSIQESSTPRGAVRPGSKLTGTVPDIHRIQQYTVSVPLATGLRGTRQYHSTEVLSRLDERAEGQFDSPNEYVTDDSFGNGVLAHSSYESDNIDGAAQGYYSDLKKQALSQKKEKTTYQSSSIPRMAGVNEALIEDYDLDEYQYAPAYANTYQSMNAGQSMLREVDPSLDAAGDFYYFPSNSHFSCQNPIHRHPNAVHRAQPRSSQKDIFNQSIQSEPATNAMYRYNDPNRRPQFNLDESPQRARESIMYPMKPAASEQVLADKSCSHRHYQKRTATSLSPLRPHPQKGESRPTMSASAYALWREFEGREIAEKYDKLKSELKNMTSLQWPEGSQSRSRDFEEKINQSMPVTASQSMVYPMVDRSEVRSELESVTEALGAYLQKIKKDYDQSHAEMERLRKQCQEQELRLSLGAGEKEELAELRREMDKLKQRNQELLEALEVAEENEEQLRDQLARYPDPNTIDSLRSIEAEAVALKQATEEMSRQMQNERQVFQNQCRAEQEEIERLRKRVKEVEHQKKEVEKYEIELAKEKIVSKDAREQLASMRTQFEARIAECLRKEDVLRYVQALTIDVDSDNPNHIHPRDANDVIGSSFADAQKNLRGKIRSLLVDKRELQAELKDSCLRYSEAEENMRVKESDFKNEIKSLEKEKVSLKSDFEEKKVALEKRNETLLFELKEERKKMYAQVTGAMEEKEKLSTKIAELEKNELKKQVEHTEEMAHLRLELDQLQMVVKDSEHGNMDKIDSLTEHLNDLTAKLKEATKEKKQIEKHSRQLEISVDGLHIQLQEAARLLGEAEKRLVEEQASCQTHQDHIQRLKADNADLKEAFHQQRSDLNELGRLFEKNLEDCLSGEEAAKLRAELAESKVASQEQAETAASLQIALAEASKQAAAPKFIIDATDQTTVRRTDEITEVVCTVAKHHHLEDENEVLRTSLNKFKESAVVQESLKKRRRDLELLEENLSTEKAAIDSLREEKEKLEKRKRLLIGRFRIFSLALSDEKRSNQIEENTRLLCDFLDGTKDMPDELVDHIRKYSIKEKELRNIEKKLSFKQNEMVTVEKRLRELQEELKETQEKIRVSTNHLQDNERLLGEMGRSKTELENHINKGLDEMVLHRLQIETNKQEIIKLNKEKNELECGISDIQVAIQRKDSEFTEMSAMRKNLADSIADLKAEEQQRLRQLKNQESQLSDKVDQLAQTEAQLKHLWDESVYTETELVRWRKELGQISEQTESKRDELKTLTRQMEEDYSKKCSLLKEVSWNLEEAERQCLHSTQVRLEAKKDSDRLRKEAGDLQATVTSKAQELSRCQQELSQVREALVAERRELESVKERKSRLSKEIDFRFT